VILICPQEVRYGALQNVTMQNSQDIAALQVGGLEWSLVTDVGAGWCVDNNDDDNDDLWIRMNDALATINLPSLTYMGGSLNIYSNVALTTISLPSLSTVVVFLQIYSSPSLTFASLPKLTFIGTSIGICQNNAAFRVPSGPPDAPTGGLTSAGRKGQNACSFQHGASTCSESDTCP
jgi:hypothetical protein